jgi:hypothetical protein
MYFEKELKPVTDLLKTNSKLFNLVLVYLVVSMIFPTESFVPNNPIIQLEYKLNKMVSEPLTMVGFTLMLYVVFLTKNSTMLILFLFLIHKLIYHKKKSYSVQLKLENDIIKPINPSDEIDEEMEK